MKSLNIKDPEAHRLAATIARETGQSMTHVVTEALRERFERLHIDGQKATLEALIAIAENIAGTRGLRIVDHGELLYDENGLPK